MSDALLIGGFLLAVVLATAGVAKLLDLEGSRRAVAAFGVPPRLAGPLGTVLPAAELGTAALLAAGALSSAAARVGGFAAVVLLAAFAAAIGANLVRGRAPDCHCFGQLHSAPAGPRALARNGALLALAACVASGGQILPTAMAGTTALALLAVVILRSRTEAPERDGLWGSEGLPLGTPAPGFQLPDPAGRVQTLDTLRARGRPVLLLFSDPDCGPCTALAPEVARWQHAHAEKLTVAVIERARDGRVPFVADEHRRRNVLFQRESEVADLYRTEGTPTAILIGRDGAIASPVAAGAHQIEALMAQAVDGFELRASSPPALRRVVGPPVRRRELLVGAAGAWAATSAILAWPMRAAAGLVPGSKRPEPCEDSFDCPEHTFMHCRDGRCVCDEGFTRCDPKEATDRKCFDLQRHRDHCGSCNHDCKGDYPVCCEGECGEFNRTRCNCGGVECGDDEVCGPDDPSYEPGCFNCVEFGWRRCGNKCGDPATQRCCGGKLYDKASLPPGEWKCCGPASRRRLINVAESEKDCGRCGHSCPRDQFCFEGRCRTKCPRGLKKCGKTCRDVKSDPKGCGDCGVKCEGPFDTGECCNGTCCDYNAQTCCPGGCTNTSLDDANCGACGNVCRPGEFCRFGECVCPLGQTCG